MKHLNPNLLGSLLTSLAIYAFFIWLAVNLVVAAQTVGNPFNEIAQRLQGK